MKIPVPTDFKNPEELLNSLSFCVIDLETTGGNHTFDQIIEIGMVKIQKMKIVGQKHYLVNPKMPIPDFIQRLTTIKNEDVKEKPTIDELLDEIMEFLGDDILVAHNISFDIPFLNSVLERHQRSRLENKVICTNIMTKHLIPEIMNSNLNYMTTLFNLSHDQAHRAIEDAKATAELLITYLNFFKGKGIRKINHLYYPKNKFEIDRTTFDSKLKSEEVLSEISHIKSPLLFTLKGEEGVIHAVIPITNIVEEKNFILEQLNQFPWKQTTVRMIGPLIEGLWQLNLHYDKLDPSFQKTIVEYMTNKYKTNDPKSILNFDFVIARHLIPEQFNLYPFTYFNPKSHLTIRYPAQKKKMAQFITNQINRYNESKQNKKILIHKNLKDVFETYINFAYQNCQDQYWFFTIEQFLTQNKKFNKELDLFVDKIKNPFNYPSKHL
jgi:DNA polymerase-3 subunit epsilon